ncbi:MAG: YdcF family protein [Acidobacteriota bacterium]|nr:YdcF family protein [Acidobacteriota bacterium]
MSARSKSSLRAWIPRLLLALFVCLALAFGLWAHSIHAQIEHYAAMDQAAPADAIAVFGAAEYDGKPSPVYRARLDHARDLYESDIAPLIITLGGDGGDEYSEGQVGHDYLIGQGIPDSDIIAETVSKSTEESVRHLTVIARTNNLRRIVVVSDATHMFRIHAICAANGLNVLTSPRPTIRVAGKTEGADSISHEVLGYMAWRLHLH